MYMLGVLGTKGGSGRSTIAAALAVEAARGGHRVGLVDLDGGQRSLTVWWALRAEGMDLGEPRVVDIVKPEVDYPATLRKAAMGPFDVVIIDGLPGNIDRTELAVKAADFVLVPVQPSPFDVLAADAVIDVVRHAGKPFAFVMSRVRARSAVTAEMRGNLKTLGEVLREEVADRAGYATGLMQGRSYPEVEKGKQRPAADEIAALWEAVERRLKKAVTAQAQRVA